MKRIFSSLILIGALLLVSAEARAEESYPDNEVLHTSGWVAGQSQDWTLEDGDGLSFVWMKTTSFSHANKAFGKGTLEIFGKLEIVMYAIRDTDGHFLTVWYQVNGRTFVASKFIAEPQRDQDRNVIAVNIRFLDGIGSTVYRCTFARPGRSGQQNRQEPRGEPRGGRDADPQIQGP